MGDHEMAMHATALYGTALTAAPTACNWWNTVPGTADLAGGLTKWHALPGGDGDHPAAGRATSRPTASSDSPGSLSNSSITFQEQPGAAGHIPVPDAAAIASFADWNQPFLSSSSAGLHGLLLQEHHHDMSSRTSSNYQLSSNHGHMSTAASLMSPSSGNLFDQQLLSSLGHELLLSPASPYGFQPSLQRSLVEPMPAKPSPGFHHMNQCNSKLPLQFTNDAPFWNPSGTAGFAVAAAEAVKPSSASARGPANLTMKGALEGVGDSSSLITTAKKTNAEAPPAFKKPRVETPSPLPTFKVRKEKLGDRITALQQLVSPFGKTDTASVLHETIDYIKFLHDQVGALSAPYLKNNGQQVQHLKAMGDSKSKDGGEAARRDLRGRGLCLVPISSTFAVASDVPVDFWAPAFGAGFR